MKNKLDFYFFFPKNEGESIIKNAIAERISLLNRKDLLIGDKCAILENSYLIDFSEYKDQSLSDSLDKMIYDLIDLDSEEILLEIESCLKSEIKINKTPVYVIFFGTEEKTSEPVRRAYAVFRKLQKLGISSELFQAIPWEK